MQLIPIKTRAFVPPKDDIYNLLNEYLPKLREGDILIVTSKIVSIHQGRCMAVSKNINKRQLALEEADLYLPGANKYSFLTIKNHAIISSAGVDTSNGKNHYILPPKNPALAARQICNYLKKKFKLKNLAVVITDSHSIPLRHGTVGISIGFYGLNPLRDFSGQKSVFGARLKTSRSNVVDALAAAATLLMGEGGDRIPLVLARGLDVAEFTNKSSGRKLFPSEKDDMYAPLLKLFRKPPR